MATSFLSIEQLTQRYPDGKGGEFTVFENASFGVEKGEFVCILGHSGCGKSTLLRMIAGLEETSRGQILIGDRDATAEAPNKRGLAMVFQSYALYPHMTVKENMGFGLKMNNVPKDEIDRKVSEASKILKLDEYLNRKPKALSGGQRQRVAIARSLINEPPLLLADEPTGALDSKTSEEIMELFTELNRTETTSLLVTHEDEIAA